MHAGFGAGDQRILSCIPRPAGSDLVPIGPKYWLSVLDPLSTASNIS